MKTNNEQKLDPLQEMTRIAIDLLELPTRGFQESYRSREPAKIIYNSKWCRINFVWGGWDYMVGNSMNI